MDLPNIPSTLQKLVETKEEKNPDGGSPIKSFRILLAQGESIEVGQPEQTPCKNNDSAVGHLPAEEPVEPECPTEAFSPGAPSADVDDVSSCSRARTEEEINSAIDQSVWD